MNRLRIVAACVCAFWMVAEYQAGGLLSAALWGLAALLAAPPSAPAAPALSPREPGEGAP